MKLLDNIKANLNRYMGRKEFGDEIQTEAELDEKLGTIAPAATTADDIKSLQARSTELEATLKTLASEKDTLKKSLDELTANHKELASQFIGFKEKAHVDSNAGSTPESGIESKGNEKSGQATIKVDTSFKPKFSTVPTFN